MFHLCRILTFIPTQNKTHLHFGKVIRLTSKSGVLGSRLILQIPFNWVYYRCLVIMHFSQAIMWFTGPMTSGLTLLGIFLNMELSLVCAQKTLVWSVCSHLKLVCSCVACAGLVISRVLFSQVSFTNTCVSTAKIYSGLSQAYQIHCNAAFLEVMTMLQPPSE